MMPIHAKDEPIDLTALIQVTYFATYEFEHAGGKFNLPRLILVLNAEERRRNQALMSE